MVAKIERLNNEKGGKLRSIVEAVNRLNPLAEATQRAHVKSLTNPGSLVHADVHAIRQELRQLLGTYALAAECGWPAAERVYQRAEDSAKWAALSVDPKGSMTELTAVRQEQLTEQARRERERFMAEMVEAARALANDPQARAEALQIAADFDAVDDGLDRLIAEERAAGIDPDEKWWE